MRTAVKVIGVLFAIAVVVSAGVWMSIVARARGALREQQQSAAAAFARFEPRITADEARWRAHPLLAHRDGDDAGPLLQKHVGWGDADAPEAIPTSLIEAFARFKDTWPAHVDELDVDGVDLGWMSSLQGFGHWDLEGPGSPLDSRPLDPLAEPAPRFIELQDIARVRLAQGLRTGDARAAARDVRELARLALTTESLVGVLAGSSLLAIEARAHDEASRRSPAAVEGWTPISADDRAALRRLLYAAPAPFMMVATPPLASHSVVVGSCAGLREGLITAGLARPFVEDDFADRYASLSSSLSSSGCRLTRMRAAWADPASPAWRLGGSAVCAAVDGSNGDGCGVPDAVLTVPFMRTWVGSTLLAIALPNWFATYDEAANPTNPTTTTPTTP